MTDHIAPLVFFSYWYAYKHDLSSFGRGPRPEVPFLLIWVYRCRVNALDKKASVKKEGTWGCISLQSTEGRSGSPYLRSGMLLEFRVGFWSLEQPRAVGRHHQLEKMGVAFSEDIEKKEKKTLSICVYGSPSSRVCMQAWLALYSSFSSQVSEYAFRLPAPPAMASSKTLAVDSRSSLEILIDDMRRASGPKTRTPSSNVSIKLNTLHQTMGSSFRF